MTDLLTWILIGVLGMIGLYLFIRLTSFAILRSLEDLKQKRKEKKNGPSDKD